MNRIMIFGISGAGKSTFALKLSRALNLPLFHVDRWFDTNHWTERPDYPELLLETVGQDHWITDGNGINFLQARYARADIVLYFRPPRWRCLWRMFKRWLYDKDPDLQDRAPQCPELIRWKLIHYIWTLDRRLQPTIKSLQEQYPHVPFRLITSEKEALAVFHEITKEPAG